MIFSEWDRIYTVTQDVKSVLMKRGFKTAIIIYDNDNKYTKAIKEICNLTIKLLQDESIWGKKNV